MDLFGSSRLSVGRQLVGPLDTERTGRGELFAVTEGKKRLVLRTVTVDSRPDGLDPMTLKVASALYLRHPNVLPLIDMDVIVPCPSVTSCPMSQTLLLFERADEDWTAWSAKPDRLARDRKRFMFQVANATAYVHSQHMVVRKLDVDSVYLVNKEAKLGDFQDTAIFHRTRPFEPLVRADRHRTLAPEILAGHDVYDAASDVWSLGMVMFHMFFGRPLLEEAGSVEESLASLFGMFGSPTGAWRAKYMESADTEEAAHAARSLEQYLVDHVESAHFGWSHQAMVQFANLVGQCLQVDPVKRPSALQVLRHPFFSNFKMVRGATVGKRLKVGRALKSTTVKEIRRGLVGSIKADVATGTADFYTAIMTISLFDRSVAFFERTIFPPHGVDTAAIVELWCACCLLAFKVCQDWSDGEDVLNMLGGTVCGSTDEARFRILSMERAVAGLLEFRFQTTQIGRLDPSLKILDRLVTVGFRQTRRQSK